MASEISQGHDLQSVPLLQGASLSVSPHEEELLGEFTKNHDARRKVRDIEAVSTSGFHSDDIYTGDGSHDLYGRPARRPKTGGWKTCFFILGTECCERLAFYGISTNLVTYLTTVLQQGNATAAKNVAVWAGTGYLTPLLGAFIADAYLGRFFTIAAFAVIYSIGLVSLTLSACLPSLKPPECTAGQQNCQSATSGQLWFFYISLYLVALGMGGIKPCVSSFGADQFDDEHRVERKQKSHFFNWFYLSINVGAIIASTLLVYIQDNLSWGLGFGIPAAAMVVAISTLFLGIPFYRYQRPGGSPLTRVARVFVAASRKFYIQVPSDGSLLYELEDGGSYEGRRKLAHTDDFKFLDKAATELGRDRKSENLPGPWSLCPVSNVEEVKQLIRLLPIWASTIFFSAVFAQMYGTFIEQGTRMDTRFGNGWSIPPASLSLFELLTVIIMVPIYDRILVRFMRKLTGHPHGVSQLQRMGVGLLISIFAIIAAALVEIQRLKIAREHELLDDSDSPVPLSIFWQVPQFALIGVAETFIYIGQLEFFYEQAPDSMRSLGTALALTTYGLGYYINSFLLEIVTRVTTAGGRPGWIPNNLNLGHLHYYYALLALGSASNLIWYWICAKYYKGKVIRR